MSETAQRLMVCQRLGLRRAVEFYAACIIADGFARTEEEKVAEHWRFTRLHGLPNATPDDAQH